MLDAATCDRFLDGALALAGERGWANLSLAAAAERAGLSLAEAYSAVPSKAALLERLVERVDRQVLELGLPDAGEPARDRLFEMIMRRLDALQPHKAGVEAIIRDLSADPLAAVGLLPPLGRSMGWMLDCAGLSATGGLGLVRIAALGAVYASVLRAWLKDDSADMAATMAALDEGLARLESLARLCPFDSHSKDRDRAG